jgi:general secretion pathway protein J
LIDNAPGPSARDDAGFTLVEVLVVLALVGLLTSALFASLRFGLHAWERTTSRAVAIDRNLLVQDFLRRAVAAAYPAFVMDDLTHGHVDFAGTATSISFLGPTPLARGLGGRTRFLIALDQSGGANALTVVAQSELAPSQAVSTVRDVLLTNLDGVEFSYFGRGRSGALEWRNTWISEPTLPQVVRLRVKYPAGDPRIWPELLISPRIDVDVACVFDLLTRRCRGR